MDGHCKTCTAMGGEGEVKKAKIGGKEGSGGEKG